MTIAAVVQMNSTPQVSENLAAAREFLEVAARANAKVALLPENFAFMGVAENDKLRVAEPEGAGPIQAWLSATARDLDLWLVGGTIPLQSAAPNKVTAACCVWNARGERVARYDKIHLFDVDIPDRNESYRESSSIAAGSDPVIVATPIGRLGLAVCYDMRFPELFRVYAKQGAQALSIPAAFTVPTGQAHWDVLLRARAIENLAYVLAPAQVGKHANGRETYGNALIVNSWGTVVARAKDGPGVVCAEIDLAEQVATRERFPALAHLKLQS